MSFKKMAAHYELTKVAKAFSDLLNKVGQAPTDLPNGEISFRPGYNVPKHQKNYGEYDAPAQSYSPSHGATPLVMRLDKAGLKFLEKFVRLYDVAKASRKSGDVVSYWNRKADRIRADFNSADQGGLFLDANEKMTVKNMINDVDLKSRASATTEETVKTASRQYLEKMASKKSIDKKAQGVPQEGSAPQQLDWAYIRTLMKDDPARYRTVQQIKQWLNSPNYILTQEADYRLRQMLQGNPMARKPPTTPTPAASTGRATGESIKEESPNVDPVYSYEGGKDYMKDKRVEFAQKRLKALGYYWGEIDGAFGPITRTAVKNFQSRSNIPATGVLDGNTYNALMTGKPASNTQPTESYADLINKANDAYLKKQWHKAMNLYEKAYEMHQDPHVKKITDWILKQV